MATAEEIAREAAEMLVTAEPFTNSAGGTDWRALIGPLQILTTFTPEASDAFLGHLRQTVATAVLAAIERAMREVPVPGALPAERLDAARRAMDEGDGLHRDALRDILADNAHLRRALHDCGQDGTASVWAAGYEAGKATTGPVRVRLTIDYGPTKVVEMAGVPGIGDTLSFARAGDDDDLWAVVESRNLDVATGIWHLFLDSDEEGGITGDDEAAWATVGFGYEVASVENLSGEEAQA